MTMVKLEWQLGWEKCERPVLEPFVSDSEEETFPTVVKLRKRTATNNNQKRKRQLVEREQVGSQSLEDGVVVGGKVPKLFSQEKEKESVEQCQQVTYDQPPMSEEGQGSNSFTDQVAENIFEEETPQPIHITSCNKDTAVPFLATSTNRHTLWQRICNTLEKRCKQYSLDGFSPPGFVVDALPDLKVSLSVELYDHGYTKDSRKILYPYDQHSKRLVQALDLGLMPPYEDLPTSHSFHYYQGCLIAEIRDFRSSFQGFLQTSIKASNKNSPVTYKLILRPDFYTILSDIDRALSRTHCNIRMETEMKMQLELLLLTVLFRNIHCDGNIRRFYYLNQVDSFKWNRIRRPRMTAKDRKRVLCSWKEFCRCASYLSPQSICLYACMMIQSFLRKERPMEGIPKTLGKLSTSEGRKVNTSHWLPNTKNPTLPSSVDELAWKPFHLRSNNNLEEHRCALYTYKRNVYLSKSIPTNSSDRSSLSGRRSCSRLRSDILRILAFSFARKNILTTKQVHCSFQIVRRDNQLYYCESRRTYIRDNSMDVNSFTTCSLEHAMDFADNFRRICEFEGYICILDSFRGPFEKVRDNNSELILETAHQKRPSNLPNNPSSYHPPLPSSSRMDSGSGLKLPNNPSMSLAQAQPAARQVSSPYYNSTGNTPTAAAYRKNLNPATNVIPQNSGSFYQGVQSEHRKRPNDGALHSNQLYTFSTSSSSPTATTPAIVMRGPKPLMAQTSTNRNTVFNTTPAMTTSTAVITNNDNSATSLGNKRTNSPVHSSTSSFHGSYMP